MREDPRKPHGVGRVVASWVWALLPFATLGWATAPCMIYAAIHKRSAVHGLLAGIYTASAIVMSIVAGAPDDSLQDNIFGALLFSVWLIGGGHALAVRRWAFDLKPTAGSRLAAQQQAAVAAVEEEAAARREARRIADSDPDLAVTLKIGRVDLPGREFPDGGLIDVNNVPLESLEQATGLPHDICQRITETRREVGGFESAAEMSVTLSLAPQLLDRIADRLVFLPSYQAASRRFGRR